MKVAVTILSVIIVAGTVYAELHESERFKQKYAECAQRLGLPYELRVDLLICAMIEDGELLYSNGAYIREENLRRMSVLISDPHKLQQAYEIFHKCDNEAVQSGAVGIAKTTRFLMCSLSIIPLLDD